MPPPPPRFNKSNGTNALAAAAAGATSGGGGASAARKQDNEYIPSFISQTPFYIAGGEGADAADSLQHQRSRSAATNDDDRAAWSESLKSRKTGPARTKWVKGACENCGAMGHARKDCLERPRKVGARFSGRDIQADRVVLVRNLGYAAKRDIYNGYDVRQHDKIVEEYNLMEEARRLAQQAQAQPNGGKDGEKKPGGEEGGEDEEGGDEEGFKYAEESDMGRDRATTKQSIRIREDTAKYLLNLDSDSAKYNPKKRALVDGGAINDKSAALFAEESYLRASGDAAEFGRAQRYAWEAQERTGDTSLHLQANPTAGAILRKKEEEERQAKRQKRAEELANLYGEQQTMPETLKELAGASKEVFVEYDEAGLIKGAPETSAKSKYAEDVFINNHTSVWGSWWSDFKWGYACCHSSVKNSYCTGETGRTSKKESDEWDKS